GRTVLPEQRSRRYDDDRERRTHHLLLPVQRLALVLLLTQPQRLATRNGRCRLPLPTTELRRSRAGPRSSTGPARLPVTPHPASSPAPTAASTHRSCRRTRSSW